MAITAAEEEATIKLLRRTSDEHLGSRLASGEAAAFDELYRRYVHRLAAYGSHLLGDAAAGEDVAQTTLLKAYTALRAGTIPTSVRPWLYRIAHNAALDLVVRRRELPSASLPERVSSQSGPTAGALVEAFAALPERQRHVYVLRELHGLRIDETAAELALTPAQVEQALFAARNRLAEHLVFGDRLDCVTVRRLAAGPLAADERRALKTHLRSCPDCRGHASLGTRTLSLLPAGPAIWLRGLLTGIGTGGAPVAVKLTTVAATAGLAVGLPASVEMSGPGSKPFRVAGLVHGKPVRPVHRSASTRILSNMRTAPASPTLIVDRAENTRPHGVVVAAGRDERGDDSSGHHGAMKANGTEGSSDGPGDGRLLAPPPPTEQSGSGGGGDGASGGGDGGRGGSSDGSGSDGPG